MRDGRTTVVAASDEATLEELIELFCDPRKAEKAERRWARHRQSDDVAQAGA